MNKERDNKTEEYITMDHGAGGELMDRFINDLVLPAFKSKEGEIPLSWLDDSAVIDDIVITTDSHTVKPIFFPGGDLGSLSVAGTVNDLLAIGARPIAIAEAIVIPEGKSLTQLHDIFESVGKTAEKAGVTIVAGDTKVVEKEDLDEPIMTTTGIGKKHPMLNKNFEDVEKRRSSWLSDNNLKEGDKIILTGSVGDHGITILSEREGYGFGGNVRSDVAPLVEVMESALKIGGVVSAKDPTRGGLASALNEWASKSNVGIEIFEKNIPIKNWVKSGSELLGLDPLTIGNEGKFILAVDKSKSEDILQAIRDTEDGRDAEIIGEVKKEISGVVLRTEVGGRRILEKPVGDPVPRIC